MFRLFTGQKVPDNKLKQIKELGIKVENMVCFEEGQKSKVSKCISDSRSTESSLSAEVPHKYLIWSDCVLIFFKHPYMAIGSCGMVMA